MRKQVEFIEIELVQDPNAPNDCLEPGDIDDLARSIVEVAYNGLEAGTLIIVDGLIQINTEKVDYGIQFSELPVVVRVPSVGVSA